jgi:hypothetical protein
MMISFEAISREVIVSESPEVPEQRQALQDCNDRRARSRELLLASTSKLNRETRSRLSRMMLESGDKVIGKTE